MLSNSPESLRSYMRSGHFSLKKVWQKDDKSKGKHEKPLPPIKPTSQEVVLPLKTPRLPEPVIIQKYTGRDMPRKNFGSIDPPQCSCMRVCRDSYFS
ncbi:uncharacterized protein LOC26535658 isoform X2 [Drosophila yakuba]|uniref:Uncharacterized protein, isoform A n=1 Tax=Drosophila yakuba TaxID=7245 RepID=A0A0R1DRX9_DROYA|nr:uncharacterized protein LOC26535658 isoform X2 [Drosophila yakuba]KRJ99742.1 uncharacterized protein Dyak_GE28477, isoform A [Drosophila yakuba]